jgi:hypothetical protein
MVTAGPAATDETADNTPSADKHSTLKDLSELLNIRIM